MSAQVKDGARLAAFAPYRLSVLSNRISRLIARDYADAFDLTIAQWRVLAIVSERERATATHIGDATHMDKVAVSRAVKALVERGLLARAADASDGRSIALTLTRAGADVCARIWPLALARERALMTALSVDERAVLMTLLGKLDAAVTQLEDGT